LAWLFFIAKSLPAAEIHGKVVDEKSGIGIAFAEVQISSAIAFELIADIETDADGQFIIKDLAPGDYTIHTTKSSYLHARQIIHSTDFVDSAKTFIVRLARCGTITGHVIDQWLGKPLIGSSVFALPQGSGGELVRGSPDTRRTTVNANGEFRLFDLAPGTYVVAVAYGASATTMSPDETAQNGQQSASGISYYRSESGVRRFTISGGEEYRDVDFSISPSDIYTVSGRVEAPSGEDCVMALTSVVDPALATAVAYADASGSFRFAGIPSGSTIY
jgi:hypothetical protein